MPAHNSRNKKTDPILLPYGATTPKNRNSGALSNDVYKLLDGKVPQIKLWRLEDERRNNISLAENLDKKIQDSAGTSVISNPAADKAVASKKIYYLIVIFLMAVVSFLYFNADFLKLNKNLKPAYELIVAPVKALNKIDLGTDVELKSEKQEIKRNLFIEQECRNLKMNDLQYDFASELNGARILSTFDTESYSESLVNFKFLGLNLGPIPNILFPSNFFDLNGPSSLLERFTKIQNCWSFRGSMGLVRISFARPIAIRKIILEDFSSFGSKKISVVDSAPRYFSIMGIDYLNNGQEVKKHLGSFEFEKNGGHAQIFLVTSDEPDYKYNSMEFQVTANHGNRDFTCVYRLKVYGSV